MGEEREPPAPRPVPRTAAPRSKRARGAIGRPGPGEFLLVVTPWGLAWAALVALSLAALFASADIAAFVALAANLVALGFWVQALRTLHRTARLLPVDSRPTAPTMSVVLLLIPLVGNLLSMWIYPTLARGLARSLARSGTESSEYLQASAIAAGVLPLMTLIAIGVGAVMRVEWLGQVVAVLSVLAQTGFFHLMQRDAHELATRDLGGDRLGRDIVRAFE